MRLEFVMPGLVPGIHVFGTIKQEGVDGRVKPGHDGNAWFAEAPRSLFWLTLC